MKAECGGNHVVHIRYMTTFRRNDLRIVNVIALHRNIETFFAALQRFDFEMSARA
jgi:hypothetical protein